MDGRMDSPILAAQREHSHSKWTNSPLPLSGFALVLLFSQWKCEETVDEQ